MFVKVTALIFLFITIVKPDGVGNYHWGYNDDNGPHTWQETCQDGFRQSPIDIKASELEISFLPKIHFIHYRRAGTVKVKNTGFSISVSGFNSWGVYQPYIFGGGLEKYTLDHFHFHWAQDHLNGSEHTVGGLHYPAEVHFVHIKDGYNLAEALEQPDGVAVVGVFLVLENEGKAMSKLNRNLQNFNNTSDSMTVHGFICDTLLPLNTEAFYRYEGSLTTPGCFESVMWTVLADPVPITQEQLDTLRELRGHTDIQHNSRPVQPLNRRKITFRPSSLSKTHLCGSAGVSTVQIGLLVFSSIMTLFNFAF